MWRPRERPCDEGMDDDAELCLWSLQRVGVVDQPGRTGAGRERRPECRRGRRAGRADREGTDQGGGTGDGYPGSQSRQRGAGRTASPDEHAAEAGGRGAARARVGAALDGRAQRPAGRGGRAGAPGGQAGAADGRLVGAPGARAGTGRGASVRASPARCLPGRRAGRWGRGRAADPEPDRVGRRHGQPGAVPGAGRHFHRIGRRTAAGVHGRRGAGRHDRVPGGTGGPPGRRNHGRPGRAPGRPAR